MTLTVHTPALRGFAAQLEGTRSGALATLKAYVTTHCGDTGALDGLLTPARLAVDNNTTSILRLLDDADQGLWLTAHDLRNAADHYDRSDAAAADRLWTTGRAWNLPKGYREQDRTVVSSGFSNGASFTLAIPAERHEVEDAKKSVHQLLGWCNKIVEWVTGYDVLGTVLPIVVSDWGKLRQLAEAHNELERACDEIAEDLERGMDTLSTQWTSDGLGGASVAFDHQLRERWIKGFRALADVANSCQQTYEWMANAYEYIVNAVLLVLNYYERRIRGALTNGAIAAENGSMKFFWHFFLLVTSVVQLVMDSIRMIYLQTKLFVSMCEMMGANLQMIYKIMRGDLDVFETK